MCYVAWCTLFHKNVLLNYITNFYNDSIKTAQIQKIIFEFLYPLLKIASMGWNIAFIS